MKKTILAMLILGSSSALFAQEGQQTTRDSAMNRSALPADSLSQTDEMTTTTNTNAYNAYGTTAAMVPATARVAFETAYPNAASPQWNQASEWWRVNYKNNGEDMTMLYNAAGQSFMLALPKRQGQVPDEVVAKAKELYGFTIYDITPMRGENDETIYGVRLIENGVLRTERIHADGSAVPANWNNNPNNSQGAQPINNSSQDSAQQGIQQSNTHQHTLSQARKQQQTSGSAGGDAPMPPIEE